MRVEGKQASRETQSHLLGSRQSLRDQWLPMIGREGPGGFLWVETGGWVNGVRGVLFHLTTTTLFSQPSPKHESNNSICGTVTDVLTDPLMD